EPAALRLPSAPPPPHPCTTGWSPGWGGDRTRPARSRTRRQRAADYRGARRTDALRITAAPDKRRRRTRAADDRSAIKTEGRRPVGGNWAPPQQCRDWGESVGTAKSERLRSVPRVYCTAR